jgi:hypothetical protein
MADHDDPEATVANALDEVQNFGRLGNAKGGRRLVEQNKFRLQK